MPVRKIAHNPLTVGNDDELERRLIQEWQNPEDSAKEPLIIEESDESHTRPTRLHVIWSAWAGIDPFARSVIIMMAYEKVRGRDQVLYVTVAEGLTFEEAQRMGIEYAPLDNAA